MAKFHCHVCNYRLNVQEMQEVEDQFLEQLPIGWTYVQTRSVGVHDSDIVVFEKDFYLCPKCRIEVGI